MKLQAYRLRNYRRLRDVVIELDDEISIFVGANNSGKTSAVQGLYSMLKGDVKKFELFDFSAALWAEIDAIGGMASTDEEAPKALPSILLDLWFRVGEDDLATAMSLLPSTEWDGKCVGIRVAFEPRNAHHHTDVRNLSRFKAGEAEALTREFLQRYLKLTHCDLFFSDAVILVEGNVERLLLPAMIESEAKRLRSAALTILEVGGAFAHRFQDLITFVGLTTLVITDLDSVMVKSEDEKSAVQASGLVDDDDEDEGLKSFELEEDDTTQPNGKKKSKKRGSTCHAHVEGAVTSNQTLISWIPKKRSVADLWQVTAEQKTLPLADQSSASVRVAYQTKVAVKVGSTSAELCGRTLEEAFGLENADWCQAEANRSVGLKLKRAPSSPEELAQKLHDRVVGKNFDKTRFALEILASGPLNGWKVPSYIAEGLAWLEVKVAHELEADTAIATEVAAIEPTAADAFAVVAGGEQTP